MKKLLFLFLIVFLFTSCMTYYRIATNFYVLQRGMTRGQFVNLIELSFNDPSGKPVIGGRPSSTKTFKYGDNVWEVWVFDVYTPVRNSFGKMVTGMFDHNEYVALKNGIVEEWGTGTLPITIRQNPTQIQLNISH
jgi:hypothetical protein